MAEPSSKQRYTEPSTPHLGISHPSSQTISSTSGKRLDTSAAASSASRNTAYVAPLIVKVPTLQAEIEAYRRRRLANLNERLYKHKVELAQDILPALIAKVEKNEEQTAKAVALAHKLIELLPKNSQIAPESLEVKWKWENVGTKTQRRAIKRERKIWWREAWNWEDDKHKTAVDGLEKWQKEKVFQQEVQSVLARCVSDVTWPGKAKKRQQESRPAIKRSKSFESVSSLEDWEWKKTWGGTPPEKPSVSVLETTTLTDNTIRRLIDMEDVETLSDEMILELCPQLEEAHECVKICNSQLRHAIKRLEVCESKWTKN